LALDDTSGVNEARGRKPTVEDLARVRKMVMHPDTWNKYFSNVPVSPAKEENRKLFHIMGGWSEEMVLLDECMPPERIACCDSSGRPLGMLVMDAEERQDGER